MKVIERKPIAVSRARCPWCLSLLEYTRRDTIDRNSDNPWGLIFDINEIEIDVYDRFSTIMIEEPIEP